MARPRKAKDEAQVIVEDKDLPFDDTAEAEDFDAIFGDKEDLFANLEGQDLRKVLPSDRKVQTTETTTYAKKINPVPQNEETQEDTSSEPKNGFVALNKKELGGMVRAEEVAADIIKERGRFIEGVDNAKAGVPFRTADTDIYAPEMPLPHADQQFHMRADGFTADSGILDTGEKAQAPEAIKRTDRDDPASPHFMVCVNKGCKYRESCMRYRMNNKREFKTVFYPEDCRRDGIYMNIDSEEFKAYDPMHLIESTSTPSF